MLLHQVNLFASFGADGYLFINMTHSLDELGLGKLAGGMRRDRLAIAPATTARVGAPRPACAECRASRRLGSAERRGVSRRRRGRDQPRRRRFATGGPVSSCRTPSTTPTCRGPSAPVSRSRAAPRPSTRSCRVAKRAGTGLQKCRHGSRHRRRVKRQHCLYFRPLPHGHESLRPVVRHRNRSSCSAVSSSALISKIGRPWRARAAIRLR